MQIKQRAVELRMALEGHSSRARIDLPLLKTVAGARIWSQCFLLERVQSVAELAKREGIDGRSVRRLIRLIFLSRWIVEAIPEGRLPPGLTVIKLTRRIDLPLLWSAQEQALGLGWPTEAGPACVRASILDGRNLLIHTDTQMDPPKSPADWSCGIPAISVAGGVLRVQAGPRIARTRALFA
jgi:hypothetical protein